MKEIYIKESPNYRQEHTLGYKIVMLTAVSLIWLAVFVAIELEG